jgi:hypothetical protein
MVEIQLAQRLALRIPLWSESTTSTPSKNIFALGHSEPELFSYLASYEKLKKNFHVNRQNRVGGKAEERRLTIGAQIANLPY